MWVGRLCGVGGLGGVVSHCLCSPQVSGEKKPVGSTAGMQTSVDTSPLLKVQGRVWGPISLRRGHFSMLGGCACVATQAKPKGSRCHECPRIGVTVTLWPWQHRAEVVVPERLELMMRHIRERDFEGFGQLTMKDSNQFHATCLDTFPPIFYLNDISRHIIALAHRFNAHHGCTKVPAGPARLLLCCGPQPGHCVPPYSTTGRLHLRCRPQRRYLHAGRHCG